MADASAAGIASAPRTRVFVSYSRKDSEFVDRLVQALEARGYDAIIDRDDISAGEAWKERLEQLILQADAVAFVVSPDAVASPICAWETSRTIELGKRLLPICCRRIEDAQAPPQLARLNYIFADSEELFDDSVARLCAACDVDIDWVREHTRFVDSAERWETTGRREATLLRGDELVAAEAWLARRQPLAPAVPETLSSYLRDSRAAEAAVLERERRILRRTQRLQLGVGALVALAAVIVLVAGFGVTRLISGLGARTSNTAAALALRASDAGLFDRSARYALAGLTDAGVPLIGYNADEAEGQLRRAVVQNRLAMLLDNGEHQLHQIVYTPSGDRVLAVASGGEVLQWNARTGIALRQLLDQESTINEIAVSPNGRILATAGSDALRLWDARSGASLGPPLTGHTQELVSLAFSPDGARLVTAAWDGTARLWSVSDRAAPSQVLRGHTGRVHVVVYSPDGAHIATASADGTARIWDGHTGAPLFVLRGHSAELSSIAYSPDGARLVTGDESGGVRLWDAHAGVQVAQALTGHDMRVFEIAFSPDSERFATAGGAVHLWNARDGAAIGESLYQEDDASGVRFSPDGKFIATSGNEVHLFDARTGEPVGEPMRGHGDGISSIAFSPDSVHVASAAWRGPPRVWAVQAAVRPERILQGHEGAVNGVAFSPDGATLATASLDGSIRIWSRRDGQEIARLQYGAPVIDVAFSPDGARLAASAGDGTARLWDVQSRTPIGRPLRGHEGIVSSIAFSPDGQRVATASDDETVRLWDARSGAPDGGPLRGHEAAVGSVAFSPDGVRVASGASDGIVRVWDGRTGAPIGAELRAHGTRISAVAFSPDGALFATASWDETVRLWDARTLAPRGAAADRHRGSINDLVFSTDGRRFATASLDRTARIWDARSAAPLGDPLSAHEGYVVAVAFSPDGVQLATASWDSRVALWRLQPAFTESRAALRRRACDMLLSARLSRLTPDELREAPVFDPVLDADACRPASVWRRLSAALGVR